MCNLHIVILPLNVIIIDVQGRRCLYEICYKKNWYEKNSNNYNHSSLNISRFII